MKTKICLYCEREYKKSEFFDRNPHYSKKRIELLWRTSKYCSKKCYKLYHKSKNYRIKRKKKNCGYCKKEFIDDSPVYSKLYCSKVCGYRVKNNISKTDSCVRCGHNNLIHLVLHHKNRKEKIIQKRI